MQPDPTAPLNPTPLNPTTPPAAQPNPLLPPPSLPQSVTDAASEAVPWDEVKAWVAANQTVAMVAAFAVGVFLGVLMRR